MGCELGAPVNGILVFGAGWEPRVSHTQRLFYCAASKAAGGAAWERAENAGFCSSVTFSGVRGCVCSPCVTAESSGSTGPPQGIQLLPEVGNVWELPLLLPPGLGFVGWLPVAEKCAWSPSRRDEAFPNPWSDGHAGPAAKEWVGRRFCCTFGEVLGYQGQISVPS